MQSFAILGRVYISKYIRIMTDPTNHSGLYNKWPPQLELLAVVIRKSGHDNMSKQCKHMQNV